MSNQETPVRRSGDNSFWRWTGNVGNSIGIVGAIGSILVGNTYLGVLFVAVIGVSAGIWLTRQKWRRTGAAFLIAGVLSGAGAAIAMSQPTDQPQTAASQSTTQARPETDTQTEPSRATSAARATPKPLVDRQIILEPGQAVDIDTPDQSVTNGQSGALGIFDLYLRPKDNNLLSQNGFYPTKGDPNTAYRDCKKILDPAAMNSSQHIPSVTSTAGLSYCFTTSDQHMTWVNIDNTNVDGVTLVNEVLRVRVWEK